MRLSWKPGHSLRILRSERGEIERVRGEACVSLNARDLLQGFVPMAAFH